MQTGPLPSIFFSPRRREGKCGDKPLSGTSPDGETETGSPTVTWLWRSRLRHDCSVHGCFCCFFSETAYVTASPFSFSLFFFLPHPPAVDRRSVWREFCLLFARFLPLQQFSPFLSLQAAVQNTGKQAGEREGEGEWETGRVLHVWFYLWTCLAVSERVRRVFPWCRLSSLFYASPSVSLCIFAIRRILRVPVSQAHLFLLE